MLSRLGNKSALGIFSGMRINDLKLQKLAPDGGSWEFLSVTADSAPSNILAARYLTSETEPLGNLLVIRCPCWPHIVSLSVYHSHHQLDVSNLSALAHLIDREKFDPIDAHVAKMVSEAKVIEADIDDATCYSLWGELIGFLIWYRGPFAPNGRTGKTDAIVRIACFCFPNGPPAPSSQWELSPGATVEMIQTLITST